MGKSSQRKGADGERELAMILRDRGYDVERGGSLSYGEVPDLVGLPGVHIEVKRVERLNVLAAMQQAIRDAENSRTVSQCCFIGGTGHRGSVQCCWRTGCSYTTAPGIRSSEVSATERRFQARQRRSQRGQYQYTSSGENASGEGGRPVAVHGKGTVTGHPPKVRVRRPRKTGS